MKINKMYYTFFAFLICYCSLTKLCLAGDGDNLFDMCPTGTTHRTVFINGLPCKSPSDITASDFKSSLLSDRGDTDNLHGSSTTLATAADFPGLNTLGLSTARTDLDVDGAVLPHTHPRASEMIFIRAGSVVVGFVDSSNRMFQKRLREGDVFLFPRGLLHFVYNAGFEDAEIYSVLNSQNPGMASIAGGLFAGNGSNVVEEMMMEKLKDVSMRDLDGVSIVDL
ncbi:hypothetical protein CASFOL_000903 [Castilleja foliolosa]|uniref:Germin-like protein n=1 Tax=Castilleja foliolosa TaxID=1961234 RepID=A0ABD3EMZ5_9LAMI